MDGWMDGQSACAMSLTPCPSLWGIWKKGLKPVLQDPPPVRCFFGQCFSCRRKRSTLKVQLPSASAMRLGLEGGLGHSSSQGEKQGRVFDHMSLREHFPVHLHDFQGTVGTGLPHCSPVAAAGGQTGRLTLTVMDGTVLSTPPHF